MAGVAGPESANNAGAQTSFIPLLTLGIPANPVMALMVGAMIIQGIVPGPNVASEQPALFWGIIASMWIGNLMLVVLNLPLIGLWIKLLSIPRPWLYGGILLFATLGTIGVNPSPVELGMLILFGLMGYGMRLYGYPIAPVVVGLILGPMAEVQLRRALNGGERFVMRARLRCFDGNYRWFLARGMVSHGGGALGDRFPRMMLLGWTGIAIPEAHGGLATLGFQLGFQAFKIVKIVADVIVSVHHTPPIPLCCSPPVLQPVAEFYRWRLAATNIAAPLPRINVPQHLCSTVKTEYSTREFAASVRLSAEPGTETGKAGPGR